MDQWLVDTEHETDCWRMPTPSANIGVILSGSGSYGVGDRQHLERDRILSIRIEVSGITHRQSPQESSPQRGLRKDLAVMGTSQVRNEAQRPEPAITASNPGGRTLPVTGNAWGPVTLQGSRPRKWATHGAPPRK